MVQVGSEEVEKMTTSPTLEELECNFEENPTDLVSSY